jgi:hypothetical protein
MSMDQEARRQSQGRSVPDWVRGVNKDQAGPPPEVSLRRNLMNFGKLRPQIFLSILCATIFSCVGLYVGVVLNAVEIVTAIVGGLFGFLAGVSLKVLENE